MLAPPEALQRERGGKRGQTKPTDVARGASRGFGMLEDSESPRAGRNGEQLTSTAGKSTFLTQGGDKDSKGILEIFRSWVDIRH
jgi:hypothetical protein